MLGAARVYANNWNAFQLIQVNQVSLLGDR